MSWQPDKDLELAVQKVLGRAREQTVLWARAERERVANADAARGVRSIHGFEGVKREEMSRYGQTAVRDVLDLFTRIFGDVPSEAAPWIQQTLNEAVDGSVQALTAQLEEARTQMQIPVRGAGEEIARIGAETKRDLDIELSIIRLRPRHRLTVVADVLGDFLGLAREALKRGGDAQNVAAVLVAASYEDTIRKIGETTAGVSGRPDLSAVLQAIKTAGIIIGPQFTTAQGYQTFRNHALHAEWAKVEKSTINSCLAFVEELLSQHFR